MTILPLLIDTLPEYLRDGSAVRSLLLTPTGTKLLLQDICQRIAEVCEESPTIVATFAPSSEYETALRQAAMLEAVVGLTEIDEILDGHEPSDWLLVVDPHTMPQAGADYQDLLIDLSETRETRHLVALDNGNQGTREYVQLDAQGQVRRIQRFYDGVTWLQTSAVAASLLPISAAREVPTSMFGDPTALREALVTNRAVSRDFGLTGNVFNLNREHGLLQWCEHRMRDGMLRPPPAGYTARAAGVWVGNRCCVDPSARLFGPVILHAGVCVEADATLVGPVVVGAESRIGHGALLAECLVAPGTDVPPRGYAQRRVLCGKVERGEVHSIESETDPNGQWQEKSVRIVPIHKKSQRRSNKQRRDRYIAVKRVLEGLLALLGLIIVSPLMLLTALAVKLTSRGPLFFAHEREGKAGIPFPCYKFRTMVADAHRQQRALYRENAVDGPQFKMSHDPRITRVGNFLRSSNLDELPQLFNVFLGQMSLIGPRPSPFRENQICVPWREARLAVRPGITGLWQLCRHERSAGDFHQWIHYDMLYVRHISFWLDLKILLTTLFTLGGRWSVPVTWLIPSWQLYPRHERIPEGQQPGAQPVSTTAAN